LANYLLKDGVYYKAMILEVRPCTSRTDRGLEEEKIRVEGTEKKEKKKKRKKRKKEEKSGKTDG
jgi:hypothetical protein